MKLKNKGILFIISSPSGGGKTTITNFIIKYDSRVIRSISATTRNPRVGEVDKVDYFFVNEWQFSSMIKSDEMLEHAKVFDNYYGTPKQHIEETLEKGLDVICCIDWQGAIQIQKKMSCVSIFILPPSFESLRNRLIKRGKDDKDSMNGRLFKAKDEIIHYDKYNYVLINQALDKTIEDVYSIIKAERCKLDNQDYTNTFVNALLKEELQPYEDG